ncbi:MAG: peptidoglycan DD-metalloendopeptidase family protein [Lachnospiraceae bacterium]|nr:peptidoglycan DD-metalloendopeptidase family protein [Lachnospiraceae bacterium]
MLKVQYSISRTVIIVFCVAVVFLVSAAFSYCYILAGELDQSNNNILAFQGQVDELMEQNEELMEQNESLITENEELQEKVSILSDTVNNKVQKEQEREAEIAQTYIPTGFPLKGSATYNESETELDGNPIAVFHTALGTSVIATANGTVSSIAGDADVGYIVMVDHGNGYYTVYRNGTMPSVKEGEDVTNITELFRIEEGNETLGYQIIENNQFIDPLSLMETYG